MTADRTRARSIIGSGLVSRAAALVFAEIMIEVDELDITPAQYLTQCKRDVLRGVIPIATAENLR